MSILKQDVTLAKGMGLFSIALGLIELTAGHRVARKLGLGRAGLVQAFGVREIANGFAVLTQPDNAAAMWGRVAGDAMDLAVLASALGRHNRRRHNAAWATIAVAGATLLDVACAAALTRRAQRAHTTARDARVASS